MLRKKANGVANGPQTSSFIGKATKKVVDRRQFLRGSGLAIGGIAAASALISSNVKSVKALGASGGSISVKKSVCTHCSVGCTVMAEVQNGVWTGQEPGWDSPINLGAHCAKGASVRETASGERRLKYPLKLVNGKWTKLSWDQAIDEIGDKIAVSVLEFIQNENNIILINRLKEYGLNMEISRKKLEQSSNLLQGKKIVVSGKFNVHSRDEIKDMITLHGGQIVSSVSAQTNLIVAGENMGPSKLAKAKSLDIEILTESEFLTQLDLDQNSSPENSTGQVSLF